MSVYKEEFLDRVERHLDLAMMTSISSDMRHYRRLPAWLRALSNFMVNFSPSTDADVVELREKIDEFLHIMITGREKTKKALR